MRGQISKFIFITIQLTFYGIFLTLDILEKNIALSNNIKFALVVLCFLYSIVSGIRSKSKDSMYLVLALLFTVVSDILILLSDFYFYGLLTFIIAQQLYGLRIDNLRYREKDYKLPTNWGRELLIRLLYQGAMVLISSLILWLADVTMDALLVVSIIYFISICTNVVRLLRLFVSHHDKRNIRYFTAGMVLFLLCDINVGLFNLSDFLTVTSTYEIIYELSAVLMWTFYAPSQVLLALSGD